MKSGLMLAVAVLPTLIGCREEPTSAKPAAVPAKVVASPSHEVNLEAAIKNARIERDEARGAVEELHGHKRMLQSELKDLHRLRDDLTEKLRGIEREKVKLAEEIDALQKKLDIEMEGFENACLVEPIHETFQKMADRLETALKENRELKETLKAYELRLENRGDR